MPRYRIEELSFIDNKLTQPGSEIETSATPAGHWAPLDKAAEKAVADWKKEEVTRTGHANALAQKVLEANSLLESIGQG
jgi:hypothetical protein